MNEVNKKNSFINNIKNIFLKNLRTIIIVVIIFIFLFASIQTYNYFSLQNLKNTSINFFNTIEGTNDIVSDLEDLKNNDNIYGTLSILKLIQKNNTEKNFSISNELYKEIIFSEKLNNLYISAISVHASYTLINASYENNTKEYIEDISTFISNIDDNLESYFSLKEELKYLLLLTEIDINNYDYKNNSEIISLYNSIYNSEIILPSVKERVKKIHEFQLYN